MKKKEKNRQVLKKLTNLFMSWREVKNEWREEQVRMKILCYVLRLMPHDREKIFLEISMHKQKNFSL